MLSDANLPLQQLCELAAAAAQKAGQFIRSVDRDQVLRQFKDAGTSAASQLVTRVDVTSEAIIRGALEGASKQWDIAFVGEESSEYRPGGVQERSVKPFSWCVDPLDGTLPFMNGGAGYAVSIALLDHAGVPLIGVVYDPLDSTLIHAVRGAGAFRDGVRISGPRSASTSLMVFADASFCRHKHHAQTLEALKVCAKHFGLAGVKVILGSGAVKNACQVLDYPAACYVKIPKPENGGGSIWDFAATACIASETGRWVTDVYGQALEFDRQDSMFMNHKGVIYASNESMGRYLVHKL